MSDDQKLERDELFKNEEILDHDYDGIRELNNGMPFWLSGLFLSSIIFGFIYYIHYTSTAGISLQEEYQRDLAKLEQLKQEAGKASGSQNWLKELPSEEAMSLGLQNYSAKCAVCHGAKGEGGIGPNLTDKYWLHGNGSVEDTQQVIHDGVTAKGMPAWGQVMDAKELAATTIYIHSLIGSTPENPKDPQGNLIE